MIHSVKSLFSLSALTLCLVVISQGEESKTERIKALDAKIAALQLERAALLEEMPPTISAAPANPGLFDKNGKINPGISNAVLIIEGDQSVGTGFVVLSEEKKYLYTAAHVFSGNSKLKIKNTTGITFTKFGTFEAAEGADLIRMEILDEVKDALEIAPEGAGIQINSEIAALGNGGGTGVIAVEKGRILGTSADSLEVDAGIIQGNSGGPVVYQSSGKVVGLVTHLTNERKDLWSEGTRQAAVRRFACRVDKNWHWKSMKVAEFLADAKELADFDEQTRLCFAMAQLEPLSNGLRLDQTVGEGGSAMEILDRNRSNEMVRSLIQMNNDLSSSKSKLSETELKKKFRSLIGQMHSRAKRSSDAFAPQNYAWFHRNQSGVSIEARQECLKALQYDLDNLR